MILGQTIIPIYLPMPTGGDIPTEDVNILLISSAGVIGLIVGVAIGLLLYDKIFKED